MQIQLGIPADVVHTTSKGLQGNRCAENDKKRFVQNTNSNFKFANVKVFSDSLIVQVFTSEHQAIESFLIVKKNDLTLWKMNSRFVWGVKLH
ncbi:MAG: hypothetical protein PF517_17890 [Salinivirgaceae bacterium]|nr:hypothetical protein [Salinivirgaceae bacterium]